LAASMPLGPLRETCVQPAPKSRLAVSGLFEFEDQKRIKSFPAKAGPTVGANLTGCMRFLGRTGFSREEAGLSDVYFCALTLIVPTLCVGMHPGTLRVIPDGSAIYFPGVSVRRCLP
ncbi:hypothetical protein, partial [Pseudomonas syringae]